MIGLHPGVKTFDKTFQNHFRRGSASRSCVMFLPPPRVSSKPGFCTHGAYVYEIKEQKKALKAALKCSLLKGTEMLYQ